MRPGFFMEAPVLDPLLLALSVPVGQTYDGQTPWFQNTTKTCQVYKSVVQDHPCYSFGATRTWEEWLVDFLALELPTHDHQDYGPVHFGFYLDTIDAINAIDADLASLGRPSFYVAGHSKGASESLLAHAEFKARGRAPLGSRHYEPAMIGGPQMTAWLAGEDIGWTQTFNAQGPDIVTVEPPGWAWEHQGALTRLQVPDTYGFAQKHEIPAVLAAVQAELPQ